MKQCITCLSTDNGFVTEGRSSCIVCERQKKLVAARKSYSNNKHKAVQYRQLNKESITQKRKEYYQLNKEKIKAAVAQYRALNPQKAESTFLKTTYGITLEQYNQMLQKQGGVCKICSKPPKIDGKGPAASLHVDHCHITNKIRGLLCLNCNTGLGKFFDNSELLNKAMTYLGAN